MLAIRTYWDKFSLISNVPGNRGNVKYSMAEQVFGISKLFLYKHGPLIRSPYKCPP